MSLETYNPPLCYPYIFASPPSFLWINERTVQIKISKMIDKTGVGKVIYDPLMGRKEIFVFYFLFCVAVYMLFS